MIQKEKRVKQDFDMLVFLDDLALKTKQIMNGSYQVDENSGKKVDYFGKRDLWMRENIGRELFAVSEFISAANGMKPKTYGDYEIRRKNQQMALSHLLKLRDAIKLAAFFISRISKNSVNEWTGKKIALEKCLEGWIDSDYERYHILPK